MSRTAAAGVAAGAVVALFVVVMALWGLASAVEGRAARQDRTRSTVAACDRLPDVAQRAACWARAFDSREDGLP